MTPIYTHDCNQENGCRYLCSTTNGDGQKDLLDWYIHEGATPEDIVLIWRYGNKGYEYGSYTLRFYARHFCQPVKWEDKFLLSHIDLMAETILRRFAPEHLDKLGLA